MLEVHRDEKVFLEEPDIFIPYAKPRRGRTLVKAQPNVKPNWLDKLVLSIAEEQWILEEIKDTVKGKLMLQVHKQNVWV